MELNQYVTDAVRTESRIDTIQTNSENLIAVARIFVAAGNLLDDLKKNIFYGKYINDDKWVEQLATISRESEQLSFIPNDEDKDDLDSIDPRLFHAIIGLATESTELVEAVLKAIDDNVDIDHVNVQEELGDINWYQAIAVDASGADWNKILETNIAKLKARYPNKFTSEDAINRDLVTERLILEGGM